MIKTRKELNFYLKADSIMNGLDSKRGLFDCLHDYLNGGDRIRRFLIYMRKYDYYSHKHGFVSKLFHAWYSIKYFRMSMKLGFSISPTSFGYGLVIPHNGTIVVGGKNRIGNYAVLHTSTCIASTNNTIGDGLYMSTGAKIVHHVELGDYISIAANSVVNKSCDECGSLLAGAPAIIKKKNKPWWVRDGLVYQKRHDEVEILKTKML